MFFPFNIIGMIKSLHMEVVRLGGTTGILYTFCINRWRADLRDAIQVLYWNYSNQGKDGW